MHAWAPMLLFTCICPQTTTTNANTYALTSVIYGLYKHTVVGWNTPLSPTCNACYPCCGPVRPTGTPARAGWPTPSLLHSFNWNMLHRPLGLSPLVTTATQVTVSTHKTAATDAVALVIAARRNRTVRAAATVRTLLALCIPPAAWLER